jgi:hypothetical protein
MIFIEQVFQMRLYIYELIKIILLIWNNALYTSTITQIDGLEKNK